MKASYWIQFAGQMPSIWLRRRACASRYVLQNSSMLCTQCYDVRSGLAAFNDLAHTARPRLQRSPHRLEMLGVVVVLARNGSRRMIEHALDDLIRNAHIAEAGG